MDKEFKISCPKCTQKIRVHVEMVGERLACPTCGLEQTVPNPYADPSLTNGVNTRILFASNEPTIDYGARTMLENSGCTVHCRNTFLAAQQYLMVQQPDLLIVDNALENGRGLELCRLVRTDARFFNVPIFMIAEDQQGSPIEIQAFGSGVDDFIRTPIVPLVFLARVRHLIKRSVNEAIETALNVQVSAKELPGILQYLDTEKKTGYLTIASKFHEAVLAIRDGRLVNATLDGAGIGQEVVTEALLWATSKVTLVEEVIADVACAFEHRFTGILMKSVVEVDEINNIKQNMPSAHATFAKGHPLPEKCSPQKANLYDLALRGHSVEDLIRKSELHESQAYVWFNELLQSENLVVGEPAFYNYQETCGKIYDDSEQHLAVRQVRQALVSKTDSAQPTQLSVAEGVDWEQSVPRVFIIGDNLDHVAALLRSLYVIYASMSAMRMPQRALSPSTTAFRFDLTATRGPHAALEIVLLPLVSDDDFYDELQTVVRNPLFALHLVSGQDRDTNRHGSRAHKIFRSLFKGVYCHVIPRVPTVDGMLTYKISCAHCGFRLAVGMDEAGFSGECPVCSEDISIPDCVYNMVDVLHLPPDLPIVTIDPRDPPQVRDLFILLLDSVLNFSNPARSANQESTDGVGSVRKERIAKTLVKLVDSQYINLREYGM